MFELAKTIEAIRGEQAGGWLFYGMRHRDKLSARILSIAEDSKETRPWYYFVFSEGEPLRIAHSIEAGALAGLPGRLVSYSSRAELLDHLARLVGPRLAGRPLACQFSSEIPAISLLDHGTALTLHEAGLALCSSAGLIQRYAGLLSPEAADSHRRAAVHLYELVELVWRRLCAELKSGAALHEGHVQGWMLDEFRTRGLESEDPPTVAAGANSSDPHYSIKGSGKRLENGQVVQLDLWAREKRPDSAYADISWVGYLGEKAPERVEKAWTAAVGARDAALRFIAARLAGGVTGAEVDQEVRRTVESSGFAAGLKHRTGHGIDRDVHGSGVNLDSVEFPDRRRLLEGSCFSVEPGIYLGDFGLRTEINVLISRGAPEITGGAPQAGLLTLV